MRVWSETDNSGVALLTIDNPPMNALHPTVLERLFEQLKECQENPDVKGIIITGASGKFTAGFDIHQFQKPETNARRLSADVNLAFSDLLESGTKPTVAAIDGICLGGGCELAVACNGRICTPASRIGLPELQLGIIPGFGGTQRLPRLVGVKKGLEMMLTSKVLAAEDAQKTGLVEYVVDRNALLSKAKNFALDMASGKKPKLTTLSRTDQLEDFSEALQIFDFAHAQSKQQAPALEHPHLCIDAVRYGVEHGGQKGLEQEQMLFAKCSALDTHKALVHVFFSMRATKRIPGITNEGLVPRPIHKAAVLGGGLMGSGIVTSLILAGIPVLLKEINQEFLNGGMKRVKENLQSLGRRGKLSNDRAMRAFSLVKGVLDYGDFHSVDFVIEAVLEDIELKRKIFADLEKHCSKACILATNTSTIDITLVGGLTQASDRIIGAHFFSPAHLMPLLEIVRSEQTSKQAIVDTLELSSRIKKTPVLVGNCTGFAVNRVFFPYTMAACFLVDLGLDPYQIDRVIHGLFGMPYGPFRLSDLVGADVGLHVATNFVGEFPERVYRTPLFTIMNRYRRFGEKTGKGFYKFSKGRTALPDPDLQSILAESRSSAGFISPGEKPVKMTDQDIIEFIFFPVINEGCRVISDGVVAKASDLDVASILGMGFPPYRGGLVFWADLIGSTYIHDKLLSFAQMLPNQAAFFNPCPYLQQCATAGKTLESGPSASSKM